MHRQLCLSDWLSLEVLPALAFLAFFYLALVVFLCGFTFGGSGGGCGLLDDDEVGNSSFLSGDLGFIEILILCNSWVSPFNLSICCCA